MTLNDELEAWDRLSDEVMSEYADVWEALAKGYTKKDLAIAAILRSIVGDIEGPRPANWADIAYALRWILSQIQPGQAPWWRDIGTDTVDANTTNDDYSVIVIQ